MLFSDRNTPTTPCERRTAEPQASWLANCWHVLPSSETVTN